VGEGNGRQAIFLTQEGLVSLKPANGELHWKPPLRDKIFESSTTPVKAGDMLIASAITVGRVALKMQSKDGEPAVPPKGKDHPLTCYCSTPVPVGNDYVYMVIGEVDLNPFSKKKPTTSLRCLETATGKELWKKAGVGTYHASLTRTCDDKLLLLEEHGDLVLV